MNYNETFSFSYSISKNELIEVADLVAKFAELNSPHLREWYIRLTFSNGVKKDYYDLKK